LDDRFDIVVLRNGDDAATLNRSILLAGRDLLIQPEGAKPLGDCLAELAHAAGAHDRIAAVTGVPVDGTVQDDEARAASGLPVVTELPAADSGFLMIRRPVLQMIGGLDPAFGDARAALTDWCLRAQRVGYVTVRANRAWFRTDEKPAFAEAPKLAQRHPSWPFQRSRALRDIAARLPYQALAAARGKMTVCLDLRYLLERTINGSGVYAVELARALAKETPARVFSVVSTEGQRRKLQALGIEVFLEQDNVPPFDVVHRPSQVFTPTDLPWLLGAQAPLVLTYQDLIAYRAPTAFPTAEDHALYLDMSHLSARSAQAVIAISQHNRGEIISELQVPEERVPVVAHGVDGGRFDKRVEPPAGVPPAYFLCVGADYAHKNLRVVLAAYAQLRARWKGPAEPPALVLVGPASHTAGGVFPDLRRAAPSGVIYLDQVSDPHLVALYAGTLALVFLSAYEGFGLPILEAMAAGAPVLCSRLSAVPEVAGDAAAYVDPLDDAAVAERLLALATDGALRQRLGAAGKARAAGFTWADAARRTFAVYQQVLRAPSAASLQERRRWAAVAARLW
jgi:alpha-1,3-rhamnosyl/mannosyltransferase